MPDDIVKNAGQENAPEDEQDTAQPLRPKTKEEQVKQLIQVVCICKGINLGRVLKGLEGCETVQDVNRKTGCGSGGCKGERCGPRIKILLNKKREAEARKRAKPLTP